MHRLAANGCAALVVFFVLFAPIGAAAGFADHETPKLANYFLHWTVSQGEAHELARWDIVILDMEVARRSPDAIRTIRAENPKVVILAYITPAEIRTDAVDLFEVAPLRARLARRIAPEWYLTNAAGARRSFWSGTWIVNVTDRRWTDALVEFLRSEVVADGSFDGVFFDNAWESITTFAGPDVDLDRDGRSDAPATANEAWRAGLRTLYARARAALPPGTAIMENDGPLYAPSVQGVQIESFPRGGWVSRMRDAERIGTTALPPRAVLMNSNTENTGRRDDWRRFRFGFGSAMLRNAYAGFDYGDQDHGQVWWYDEYDASLGSPVSPARRVDTGPGPGMWQRDFERGVVVVNAGSLAKTVRLRLEAERVRGTQDPATNNGRVAREVTIAAEDSAVLLRPIESVTGATFENGSFARVLRADGAPARNGFLARDATASPGALVLRADLGRDHVAELITAENGIVEIRDAGGSLLARFAPYGPRFRGPLSLAAGDMDGDGLNDLITAPASRGGAHVRVWSGRGVLKNEFFAFDAAFQGGASVAAGDLTGDGRPEIVVGAGPGGAPLLRIFDASGRADGPASLAEVPAFRGGVRVASGDLDGDGRAEIVTGAGPGGAPTLRIWEADRALRAKFTPFDASVTGGIIVGVADPDGDGRNEVVVFSRE